MEASRRETNVTLVGVVAVLLAVGAMAIDHLLGTDRSGDEGLVDPAMFAVSVVLTLAVAAALFGWLVPKVQRSGPERAARVGLVCSVASLVPGVALIWVGFPFVVAGAGVALGLERRGSARRNEATAAFAIGVAVLALGAVAYAVAAVI